MTSEEPLFTIIVPTFNRAQLLQIAIKSVIDQIYTNWELLIIDDGSNDNTKSVVLSFKDNRIKYFDQPYQERSMARNRGIEESTGKYICFMDDDDHYLKNHLSTFYETLKKFNFPEMILRTGFVKKNNEKLTKTSLYDIDLDLNPVRFAAFNFCSVCTLCIPRPCLEHNRFPSNFQAWEDTHLILRILSKYPFYQIPQFTYVYMIHPTMGSKTIYHLKDAEERIQNNVDAILDLFNRFGQMINPYLPANTKEYLVCEKYLGHANGALINGRITLALKLSWKSLKFNKKGWFIKGYLKLILKIPFIFFLSKG